MSRTNYDANVGINIGRANGGETNDDPERRNRLVREQQFEEELERRLALLEASGYEDPARRDLPTLDLAIVAIVVLAAVVVLYLWGL